MQTLPHLCCAVSGRHISYGSVPLRRQLTLHTCATAADTSQCSSGALTHHLAYCNKARVCMRAVRRCVVPCWPVPGYAVQCDTCARCGAVQCDTVWCGVVQCRAMCAMRYSAWLHLFLMGQCSWASAVFLEQKHSTSGNNRCMPCSKGVHATCRHCRTSAALSAAVTSATAACPSAAS